jgi:hypothetical protein
MFTHTYLLSNLPCIFGQVFVTRALGRLRAEDRGLPQIRRLQSMLRRGVGVHHAGALRVCFQGSVGYHRGRSLLSTCPGCSSA